MKNYLKLPALLLLSAVVIASCSKKDDPTDNNLFVGTYKGKISYVKEGENKSTDDGKVTVVKVGNNYNFVFSDGIPDLKGVELKTKEAMLSFLLMKMQLSLFVLLPVS